MTTKTSAVSSIDPSDVAKIESLTPLARLARRQHGETDAKVVASKELTALFKRLHKENHSISSIAAAAHMTYHSVSARIKKS